MPTAMSRFGLDCTLLLTADSLYGCPASSRCLLMSRAWGLEHHFEVMEVMEVMEVIEVMLITMVRTPHAQ